MVIHSIGTTDSLSSHMCSNGKHYALFTSRGYVPLMRLARIYFITARMCTFKLNERSKKKKHYDYKIQSNTIHIFSVYTAFNQQMLIQRRKKTITTTLYNCTCCVFACSKFTCGDMCKFCLFCLKTRIFPYS